MKIPINKGKETIILNFILDESGSMEHQRDVVISGFNEYIETMKAKSDEANYVVNLVKFGDKTENVLKNVPLVEVRKITRADYDPRFSTALFDAIGNTINLTTRQMLAYNNPTTLFFVFTDGYENASREFVADTLKKLITSRENAGGWTFTFIGADRDCLKQAADIGIGVGNMAFYNATNSAGAIRAMATSTSAYTHNLTSNSLGVLRSSKSLFQDAGLDNSRNIDDQVGGLTVNTTFDSSGNATISTTTDSEK